MKKMRQMMRNRGEKKCGNNCGNNWCCRISTHYLPLTMNASDISGCIQLFLWRGCDVYKIDCERFKGYIAIQDCPCIKLEDSKCQAYDKRPRFCRQYPDLKHFAVLPAKCPYSGDVDGILEELERVTQEDLKAIDLGLSYFDW